MNMCTHCVHKTTCVLVGFYEAKGEHITKCPRRKPITNADYIRSMSDEELAFYIINHPKWSGESAYLEWLKEEVDIGD